MNLELQERLEDFEFARHGLIGIVAGVSDEDFCRRPDGKSWSMAECIDHLLVVGWKMVPRLDTAIIEGRGNGWFAEGPFKYGALSNWFVKANGADELPPRSTFKTPRLYLPKQKTEWKIPQAVQEFTNLQEKYKIIVKGADGLDLARIKVRSPASRLLRLSLGQWLRAMGGHQKRHLWQARQTRERLGLG